MGESITAMHCFLWFCLEAGGSKRDDEQCSADSARADETVRADDDSQQYAKEYEKQTNQHVKCTHPPPAISVLGLEDMQALSRELLVADPFEQASSANKECQRNFQDIPTSHDTVSPFSDSVYQFFPYRVHLSMM
jgi:hypothetical protein